MRGVELDNFFRESFLLLEDLVKLATINEWHYEVKTCIGLEHVLHAAQELVVSFKQYVLLERRRLNLVILYQHILSDGFDCVFLACLRENGQIDSSESSLTQLHLNVEILQINIG